MRFALTRRRLAVIAAALVVVLVAGWVLLRATSDDDPYGSYCDIVKEQREAVGRAMAAGPQTGLIKALPTFEELADEAPGDIRDEWKVVLSSITELRDTLTEAGLDPATYDPDHPPKGLSAGDRDAIEAAAIRLASPDTQLAFAGVDQQARDVCKTPLFL